MKASVVVAGGGVVGSAMAWALCERGIRDVVVVDLDLTGMYASSELNAGGVRATWWQPVNIETCAATLSFFSRYAEAFGFVARGYLWLYANAERFAAARTKLALQNRFGLQVETLDENELTDRFPMLDRHLGELIGATHSPKDGLVNPNAVRAWYRQQAEQAGARFLNRSYIVGVSTSRTAPDVRRVNWLDVVEVKSRGLANDDELIRGILTTHNVSLGDVKSQQRIECDVVVNCLGAWSPIFSAKVGIHDVTEPVRRQVCLLRVQLGDGQRASLASLGMVVDTSEVYFHPEGAQILAGYSIPSEAPGFDFAYDGSAFFLNHIWPRLAHRSSWFEHCQHIRGWSGLYAVTPDCSGIAGAVGRVFELVRGALVHRPWGDAVFRHRRSDGRTDRHRSKRDRHRTAHAHALR